MSSRKVFQASSRPKASQANTLDTNLKKIDSNQTKAKRRKGVRQIEGLGDISAEPDGDQNTGRSSISEEEKLPCLSPRKEISRPKLAMRVKKVSVKGEQLKKPMGLKQRKIPTLFTPKKKKVDHGDPLSMAEIERQEAPSDEEQEGIDDDGSLTLTARLMGLPGNLELAEEMTSKYFGIEGRAKFHNRVSWVYNQRNMSCLEPDDVQHTLVFEDSSQGRALHEQIPFGATRHRASGEFKGTLKEPSFGSQASVELCAINNNGGSKFFRRFKDPVLQAQAGIGFNSRTGRLDGYVNNEDVMLRASRLRSGDDPRDEDEADANFPLRAHAREADMDEDYMRMLRAEAHEDKRDPLTSDRGVVVSPIRTATRATDGAGLGLQESKVGGGSELITPQPGSVAVLDPQEYDRLKDGGLVLGGDYSLASIDQKLDINSDIVADAGCDDHPHGLHEDKEEDASEMLSAKEELEQEKRHIRNVVRSKTRTGDSAAAPLAAGDGTWRQSYMRKHGHLLDLSAPAPAAIDMSSNFGEEESESIESSSLLPASSRDTNEEEKISRKYATRLRNVSVSKEELARLQRLAANSALVSNLTFMALSEANQTLGALGELDENDYRNDEWETESVGGESTGQTSLQDQSQNDSTESVNNITNKEHVLRYQYMQLSMTSAEKQKYYRNRRPSFVYDKPASKPKPYLAVPKRRYFRRDEAKQVAVGTGTMNKARARQEREARRAVQAQAAAIDTAIKEGRGSLVHSVSTLKQLSALPRDLDIFEHNDFGESSTPHGRGDDICDDNDDGDDDDDDDSSTASLPYYARTRSRRSSTSSSSSISTINLRAQMFEKGVSQDVPMSPRSRFISNCIRERLNPRAGLLVRKNNTKKLELQNYGMGDQMARILADSLADLPYLQSVNIADNRLTDHGMGPIINAAVRIPSLLELNLSKNEIGDVAADALAKYLRNPNCTLQRLVMQTADVDDFEAEPFIDAVKENRSLLDLDLTDNLIGGAENLNTVMPDLITGSEAIADLLRSDDIALHTLKLAWNMIRLDGAVDLCNSLSTNKSITYLDLSYNSLAQDGGISLGVALEDNTTLHTLIISNNNIDAVACFTICTGIIHNRHLKKVVFDGNPIAEQGARALMLVPLYVGGRVELSAKKCNITMRDPACWFDFDKPCRNYDLDMEDGFERAIAMILLLTIACHHSYIFSTFNHYPDKGNAKKVDEIKLKQAVSKDRMNYFQPKEAAIVEALSKIKDSAADISTAIHLFQEVDEDGSGEIDREEFAEMVRQMGIGMTEARIDEVYNTYDVDGGGSIGLSEFLAFLKTQKAEAAARIDDLCEMPIMTLDDGVPVKESKKQHYDPYEPPKEGRLEIFVEDGFVMKEIKKVLSSVDQANIQNVVAAAGDGGSGQAAMLTSHSISGAKLRLDEALAACVTMLSDGKDSTKILKMVLPQVDSFEDAQAVVKSITNGDRTALMKLKRELGGSLRPVLGAPNGYYELDLSNDMDRFCFTRLMEISSTNGALRKERNAFFPGTQIGDLSQKRNWSCFRNEYYNGQPIELDKSFSQPLPHAGHLSFDFISGSFIRPKPDDMALTDARVIKVLCNSYLLDPEDCMTALKKLKHYFVRGEAALDCDGKNIYEQPTKRAHHIGLAVEDFYDHLHLRVKENAANAIKINQVRFDDAGQVIDDLEEDHHDHDENNDTSGHSLAKSMSLVQCMAIRGIDFKKGKKGKKGRGGLDEAEESGDDEEDGSITLNQDDATASVNPSLSLGGDTSRTSVTHEGEEDSLAGDSVDPVMWKCDKCHTKNLGSENKDGGTDHCTLCGTSRPDVQHGHGIGDESGVSDMETKRVQAALKKRGNVEGSHKHDPNAHYDPDDPNAPILALRANEHAEHKKNELDSEAEESDIEASTSTESTSDDDLDGDEETDMHKFVAMKLEEKKREMKLARQAAREQRRREREEKKKKKAGMMLHDEFSDEEYADPNKEDEEKEDGDDLDVGSPKADKRKLLQGLNLLTNDQLEKQKASEERDAALDEELAEEKEENRKSLEDGGDAAVLEENEDQKQHRLTELEQYALKMREMLGKKALHIGLKAQRIVEWLEELFGRTWLFARQLALIIEVVRGIGHKKQTRYFGTYRTDLFVALFHRVIDIHNIEIVLKVMSPFEVACLYGRIGWLHLWNPCKPEGAWELSLTRPEERLVAKMLCELATVEPGDNWAEQYFQWQRDSEGMPGWELTTPWLTEEGMPCRGVLTLNYYSGAGKGLKGCSPHVPFRKSLLHLVLIEEPEIVEEGFRDRPPTNLVGDAYVYNNSGRWKQYLGAIVDLTRTR